MPSEIDKTSEPLPCPFCGHVGLDFAEGSTFRWIVASCSGCGASKGETRIQTLGQGSKAEWMAEAQRDAIADWNVRADLAQAVPAGWKLVPEEPTDEMEVAAEDAYELARSPFPDWKVAYREMLSASPRAPEAGWLPIESAPKDGTPIMGCFWEPTLPHLYAPIRIYWAAYHPNATGEVCWRDAPTCGNKAKRLTHWAYLIAAPLALSGGECETNCGALGCDPGCVKGRDHG